MGVAVIKSMTGHSRVGILRAFLWQEPMSTYLVLCLTIAFQEMTLRGRGLSLLSLPACTWVTFKHLAHSQHALHRAGFLAKLICLQARKATLLQEQPRTT